MRNPLRKGRYKHTHDLAFIALSDIHKFRIKSLDREIQLQVLTACTKVEATGPDVGYSEFVNSLNEVAVKYNCGEFRAPVEIAKQPLTGVDAFAIVYYMIEKGLHGAKKIKNIPEMVLLSADLRAVLHKYWSYSTSEKESRDSVVKMYQWAAVMAFKNNDGLRPVLEFSPRQVSTIVASARKILVTYSIIPVEFRMLFSTSHALKAGAFYGERLRLKEE